ncbi:MAG: sulfatase-like hydrolase/transferase [Acidobacteriota bacterium]
MKKRVTRRDFLCDTSLLAVAGVAGRQSVPDQAPPRPNIIWITSEDNGPHMGCYGDTYATTPHLDRLAGKGMIYSNAWSNAPVCAPARTTIISGMYPPCTGSEHMRSMVRLPEGMKMFPQFLREAGYYCTNNSKEDYNLEKPGQVWDESSTSAHWRKRPRGQPFFAVFNFTQTHESQIRRRPHQAVHDPARVRVPAYHPVDPIVRQDWAQYYDQMTEMDERAGQILAQLEQDGLLEDTIVFYYGDHGPGMPRNKRWPLNCGLRVPLIIHIPEKFRRLAPADYCPGARSDRLVAFVDLAPTVLSLAGIKPPDYMHGHAFLGEFDTPPQSYLYGFRGRMDERYDMVRSVRDRRYVYVRNFMPHKIYGQYLDYMFQTPTTRVWKELYDQGKLNPGQRAFWEVKPPEELYDLEADPDEVQNLAGSPAHSETLARFRRVQRDLALQIRDLGFLPEDEMHRRAEGRTPYAVGHSADLPLERIIDTAETASSLAAEATPRLTGLLSDPDSAVRYWASLGLLMRGRETVVASQETLRKALREGAAPSVRIVAAQALGLYGSQEDVDESVALLLDFADLKKHGLWAAVEALNALDEIDARAGDIRDKVRALPKDDPGLNPRTREYPTRLIEKILRDLDARQQGS